MRYFSLPNLSSTTVATDVDPRDFKRPDFENKEDFRAWCNEISTKHCFYSHTEGVIPSLRVTADTDGENSNPPLYLHGFTADFDSDMPLDEAIKQVVRNGDHLPLYASQTFSNGVRLTWDFEEPVFVDNKDLALRFMEELSKLVGVKKLLAGFDVASLKVAQYYEAGTNWMSIPKAKAISKRDLTALFVRAANSVQVSTETNIPLEAVEEEVLKRWPGRVKELKEGSRLPLFWVEPFEDRVGAIVGNYGMICFSTRAGKSLVTWSDILGREFAGEYQRKRIGEAAQDLYYDGRHYWRNNGAHWNHYNKEDTIMHLKAMGVSPRPAKNKFASEAEEVLVAAQINNRIDAAAPLIHDARRIAILDGQRFLNISNKPLMRPADSGTEDQFPWLKALFDNIWSAPREAQRDHYLGWLRHAYINCLAGRPTQGCATFISGPKSSGKTFLNFHILGAIFGGCTDASQFLLGNTNFNKGDSESYVWAIDDNQGSATWEAKRALSANIKKYVANPRIRVEGKGRDAYDMPWSGRISVTCNLDKESRAVLPQTHGEIMDKVCMFEWNCWRPDYLPNRGTEELVRAELPFFLKWLVDWSPPDYVVDQDPRFGIVPFHHESMVRDANENSGAAKLQEMFEDWRENLTARSKKIWATTTKIGKFLSQEPAYRDTLNKQLGRERMSQAIQELGLKHRKRPNGSIEYLIFDPEGENGDQ